jgi:hypothetical protein
MNGRIVGIVAAALITGSGLLASGETVRFREGIPFSSLAREIDAQLPRAIPETRGDRSVLSSPFQGIEGIVSGDGLEIKSLHSETSGSFTLRPTSISGMPGRIANPHRSPY